MSIADLDGDGHSEIVTGQPAKGEFHILVGPVTSNAANDDWEVVVDDFSNPLGFKNRSSMGRNSVTGDFNNDGHVDLAGANIKAFHDPDRWLPPDHPDKAKELKFQQGAVAIMFGPWNFGFRPPGQPAYSSSTVIHESEANRMNKLDLNTYHNKADWFGQSLNVADVDNDGYDDLLIGSPASATYDTQDSTYLEQRGQAYVYYGSSSTTFTPSLLKEVPCPVAVENQQNATYGWSMCSADFYEHGSGGPNAREIVVSAQQSSVPADFAGQVFIYADVSYDGSFTRLETLNPIDTYQGGAFGTTVTSADLSDPTDGVPELVVAQTRFWVGSGANYLAVYWGGAGFPSNVNHDYSPTVANHDSDGLGKSIAFGDLNNDGHLSIVAGANTHQLETSGWAPAGEGRVFVTNSPFDILTFPQHDPFDWDLDIVDATPESDVDNGNPKPFNFGFDVAVGPLGGDPNKDDIVICCPGATVDGHERAGDLRVIVK